MNNLDNRNFKGRSGFDKYQYTALCWLGFLGFVAFRIGFCFTLLLIRYFLWMSKKALDMPGSILNIGGMVIDFLIIPVEVMLKLATNYRNPETGKRETPKWRLIRDTFDAARTTPQMYRNGWIVLAITTAYSSMHLLDRFA